MASVDATPTPRRFQDESLQSRFWARVRVTEGCWLWTAGVTSAGYGQISVNGQTRYIHRLVYELYFGSIPGGLFVCHRCDDRRCVNPSHLFLGTAMDNTQDMLGKGRHKTPCGEAVGISKLTAEQVAEIRRRWEEGGVMQIELAAEYGIHSSNVSRIVRREIWKA